MPFWIHIVTNSKNISLKFIISFNWTQKTLFKTVEPKSSFETQNIFGWLAPTVVAKLSQQKNENYQSQFIFDTFQNVSIQL